MSQVAPVPVRVRVRVRVASIWAQDTQGILGTGTAMLWRVPGDLRFFQEETTGFPVIMGRSTWEALGRPLPHRDNIVVTRQPDYVAPGARVAHSIAEALTSGIASAHNRGLDTVWIAGGAQIYAATMDVVDELVITELDLTITPIPDPVAVAPKVDFATWKLDETRSDTDWRPLSGDARWKKRFYVRRNPTNSGVMLDA